VSASVDTDSGVIRLLPPEIANKIAAGEVVQRPASVLKELLDNALDAGASRIAVVLHQAGRALIQVADNGCGMASADLPNCFLRHATSKIREVDDLIRIRTLGFRGEAMASIASIAQVTVKSKRMEDASGTEYETWGGEERTYGPVATDNGTTVMVRNLFFNVPARRAFLKTDATEMRHALTVFQQMALVNPDVAFELHDEHDAIYRLQPAETDQRIADLFGKEYKASLMAVDETAGFVRIRGFVSDPKLARRNRGEQFLFVNGRPFVHRHLVHSVLEQYSPWLRDDAFPFFMLQYDLDPELVDVNVHPSKMEVRFEDERTISMLTRSVVKRVLQSRYAVPEPSPASHPFPDFAPSFPAYPESASGGMPAFAPIPSRINIAPDAADRLYAPPSPGKPEKSSGFWQLHDQYILTKTLTGLCVIDQQAAHRRILYERALQSVETGLAGTQQLLFPQSVEFSASDFALLKQLLPDLLKLGFDLTPVSGHTALVAGVPADIAAGDERDLLVSILQQYQQVHPSASLAPREKLAMAYASKTAIPRGKRLSQEEMEALFDQLFACASPYTDPGGRPTLVTMPLDEIRARFRG
jgi:DNA mismatch repair protein MutL